MGLIKAVFDSARTTLGDQWLDFMVLEPQPANVLMAKGVIKRTNPNGKQQTSNTKGSGAITDNTRVSVPAGYAFLVVENGAIKDIVVESGEYIWNTGTQPSVFESETLGTGIKNAFKDFANRIRYGGQFANEQMGIYVKMTEILGNKFGTPSQIPYNDARYGNIYIRSYGSYSFKIDNPILFIANVTSLSFDENLTVEEIFSGQVKSEFIMNLISTISTVGNENNIPFDMFTANSVKFSGELAEKMTKLWCELRGIKLISVAIEAIEPDEESKEYIREIDKATKIGSIPGYVTMRQLDAMNKLAENEGGGTPNMFMGLGLGQAFGQNMANMGMQNQGNFNQQGMPMQNQPANQRNNETFAQTNHVIVENSETPKPISANFCSECGQKLKGEEKFCPNCGKKLD